MPLEIERRFLLRHAPSASVLAGLGARRVDIVQTYLAVDGPARVRVRRARTDEVTTYTRTAKRKVGPGVREECETVITRVEYMHLLGLADRTRRPVRKRRHVFGYEGLTFELDQILAPHRLWLLEVELDDVGSLGGPLTVPAEVVVAAEVTGLAGYSNAALARRSAPCPVWIPLPRRESDTQWSGPVWRCCGR